MGKLNLFTHLVNVKVNLRSGLKLSIQSGDATSPHQVLHLVFEDEQLDAELLLAHVQESRQLCYRHGGVELQETARTFTSNHLGTTTQAGCFQNNSEHLH